MTKNIEKYNQEVDYAERILPQFFDKILWQHEGAGLDGLCSLKSCRKKLRYDEELIKIRDASTDLVAVFHISCYQSMLKPPPGSLPLNGKLKDMDMANVIWKKNTLNYKSEWHCSLRSCQKFIPCDEKSIILDDKDKKRVAVFHVDCFEALLKEASK